MKKFDIKIVLILILVCVMGFSLVACNKDDTKKPTEAKPIEVVASEYFVKLFSASKSLGSQEIKEDDNLSVSLDLNILLGNKKVVSRFENSTNIGVRASILLDRKEEGKNTAIKIQMYNKTAGGNLFTAYYFLNDSTTAYIDFQDQKFKIGFDTGFNTTTVEGETYGSTFYAGVLQGVLDKKIFENDVANNVDGKIVEDMSIFDVIDSLIKNNGADWTINDPVNTLLSVFNLSSKIKELLSSPDISGVLAMVGLTEDKLFDSNGNLDIINVLNTQILLDAAFEKGSGNKIVDKQNANRTIYNIKVASSIFGLLDSLLPASVKPFLTKDTKIALSFGVIGNDIDGFTLAVDFTGLKDTSTNLFPSIAISINDISFKAESEAITEATTKQLFGMSNKDAYSNEFNFQTEFELDMKGLKIAAGMTPDGKIVGIDMSGVYKVQINACIDLFNKGAANKTRMFSTVKLNNTTLVAVSYDIMPEPNLKGLGRLTVKTYDDAKIGGISAIKVFVEIGGEMLLDKIAEKNPNLAVGLLSGLYSDVSEESDGEKYSITLGGKTYYYSQYNENFKGVVLNNVDIIAIFKSIVKWTEPTPIPEPEEPTPADPASAKEKVDTSKDVFKITPDIAEILKMASGALSSSNNGRTGTLKLDSLVGTLKKVVGGLEADDDILAYILGKNQDVIDYFTHLGLIKQSDGQNKTPRTISRNEARMMYRYLAGIKGYEYADYLKATSKTGTDELKAEFDAIIQNYAPFKVSMMLYPSDFLNGATDYTALNKLAAAKVTIIGDVSNGFGLNVGLAIGETSIGLGFRISAKADLPTWTSISPAAGATDGWIILGNPPEEVNTLTRFY